MRIIKKGRKVTEPEPGIRADQVELPTLPFPQDWRGPHTCPICSCKFELNDKDKNLVHVPEIAMGCDADYHLIGCPNCGEGIRL